MSKQQYIGKIKSYLNDGFVTYPADINTTLKVEGLSIVDLRSWTEIAKNSLQSLVDSNKLVLIPEGILSDIVNHMDNIVNNAAAMDPIGDPNLANRIQNCLSWIEQIIAITVPYLNLSDSTKYESLSEDVDTLLQDTRDSIDEDKEEIKKQQRSLNTLSSKSLKLLRGISSGVLSKNFHELSNSKWNWVLMSLSTLIALLGFVILVRTTSNVTHYLTEALTKDNLDYRVFFAKWSTTIPWLLLTSIGLLELRSRIRYRDIYLYRQSVAGSLDGYTEYLLTKIEDITDQAEKSEARKTVLQFMTNSMTELTRSPSIGSQKNSVAFKVRDIAEASFNTKN